MVKDPSALLAPAVVDARRLITAAESDWSRPIHQCPGWDSAELVRHTGQVLKRISAILSGGHRVDREDLDPPPQSRTELPRWYAANLAETVERLSNAQPDAPAWTFSRRGEHRVAWWCRRLAVEVAIHRWDVEHAAAGRATAVTPLDSDVAAAGIEEFFTEFLDGLLERERALGLSGTLCLQATDAPVEWWVDVALPRHAIPESARADTVIRGPVSDLLLWLVVRPTTAIEVIGSRVIPDSWRHLGR
jgi:uncharacterized protein (TIGR03083 family)